MSNASLAVAALVHVISKNATAWQSVSMTMLVVGLAGWYAVYTPLLAMAVSRIRKHPNCHQMPGAWMRWHMHVGTIPAAIGFLGCLVASPIAYAISPNAGIWTIGVCGFILLTGVLVQLLGSWAYAGSTLRRTRPGTGYRADSRSLWILPVAVGAMIAFAAMAWLANDTMLAILLSLLTLASVVLVRRLLQALLAIRRGEKLVRPRATPNR